MTPSHWTAQNTIGKERQIVVVLHQQVVAIETIAYSYSSKSSSIWVRQALIKLKLL